MPNLKGEEFTEFEKKAIMQIFLSHDDVKKRLYEIIFSDGDKSNKDRQLPNEKVKISFEELGI